MISVLAVGVYGMALAIAVLAAAIIVHLVLRRMSSRLRHDPGDVIFHVLLVVAGTVAVAFLVTRLGGESASAAFRLAAAMFYLALCLVYLEIQSLLSRGYSLRILVDIAAHGGSVDIPSLKATYGGGMGVSGLVAKRLRSLNRLGLVELDSDSVGPLTRTGRIAAALTIGFRRLLRLEVVG